MRHGNRPNILGSYPVALWGKGMFWNQPWSQMLQYTGNKNFNSLKALACSSVNGFTDTSCALGCWESWKEGI